MSLRDEIVGFCADFLKVREFEDYCHNGLQVEGRAELEKIVTGVSLSERLIRAGIEKKAGMIIVHHGVFADQLGKPPVVKGVFRNRLKLLLSHDINLLGFHLPLDAHPQIGNNISLCKLLGLENIEPVDIGFQGELKQTMDLDDFVDTIRQNVSKSIVPEKDVVRSAGSPKVSKVGVVSGGASNYYEKFEGTGIDTFLCGDLRENVVREVEELGINLINAGHYNTEKFGVRNLGQKVAGEFNIDVEFIDVPNSV